MSDKKHFLIDTDILVDHLTQSRDSKSMLEKAMAAGICFTTVINASELYLAAASDEEQLAIDKLLGSLKILGIHYRYSLSVKKYSGKKGDLRDILIIVIAENNKLQILTNKKEKYKFADIELADNNL